jgi:hypothetical protein
MDDRPPSSPIGILGPVQLAGLNAEDWSGAACKILLKDRSRRIQP